jgi:hypothetical protein
MDKFGEDRVIDVSILYFDPQVCEKIHDGLAWSTLKAGEGSIRQWIVKTER